MENLYGGQDDYETLVKQPQAPPSPDSLKLLSLVPELVP